VPVTARLSRKFYERFGDDIAGEFVDWFNAVDTTYHQQLRDLNDLNWERFKAELHSAIAQSEARMTEKLVQLSQEFSEKLSAMKSDVSGTRAELQSEISRSRSDLRSEIADLKADLRSEISDSKSDIMKWMFIYWSGTVLSLGGLMIAILRR
jgi:gas vesicle protein